MSAWFSVVTDLLWHSAMAVIPLALIVGAFCRWVPCRPATRHALWLCVLGSLLVGLVLPPISVPMSGGGAGAEIADSIQRAAVGGDSAGHGAIVAPACDVPHSFDSGPEAERGFPPKEEGPSHWPSFDSHRPTTITRQPTATPPWTVARTEPGVTPLDDSAEGSVGLLFDLDRAAGETNTDSSRVAGALGAASERGGHDVAGTSRRSITPKSVERPGDGCAAPALSGKQPAVARVGPVDVRARNSVLTQTPTAAPKGGATFGELIAILGDHFGGWVSGLMAIRDAVGRLPTIPPAIWLGGILLALAIQGSQIVRFRRRIRAGVPAPASVTRFVRDAAREFGMRAAPQTIMVRGRTSPMIWCGRRTTLVLPRALWSDLDEAGRRAVVLHELAHVYRRDHWVCWVELLVGAVYWWHPLIWWVRGRLRDEAENCCDAWVTWLLPRDRRVYAEALIRTKQFVSEPDAMIPSAGIGVLRGRTKHFARRLTMIMTEHVTPSRSATGIVLALAVFCAGWVATPARSCEHEPKKPASPVVPTAQSGHEVPAPTIGVAPSVTVVQPVPTRPSTLSDLRVAPVPVASAVPSAPALTRVSGPMPAPLPVGVGSTVALGGFPLPPRKSRGSQLDIEVRIMRLEDQIRQLSDAIEKLTGRQGDHDAGATTTGLAQRYAEVYDPPPAVRSYGGRAGASAGVPRFAGTGGPIVVRSYPMPKGRLDALTELMVRSDVPIRVRPDDDHIEVHATEDDQAKFEAFVNMIIGEEEAAAFELPEGKLRALTALMSRKDVPVRIKATPDAIEVHGKPAVQSVFKAFVEMIHPTKSAGRRLPARKKPDKRLPPHARTDTGVGRTWAAPARAAREAQRQAQRDVVEAMQARQTAQAAEMRAQQEAIAGIARARAAEGRHHAEAAAQYQKLRELMRTAEALQAEAERIEHEADRLEEEAERLRDRSSELRDEAWEIGNRKKAERLVDEADALERQAEEVDREAEVLQEQAEELEDQAERIESHTEAIEDRLDELEDEA